MTLCYNSRLAKIEILKFTVRSVSSVRFNNSLRFNSPLSVNKRSEIPQLFLKKIGSTGISVFLLKRNTFIQGENVMAPKNESVFGYQNK